MAIKIIFITDEKMSFYVFSKAKQMLAFALFLDHY
jgi:hypothetical protein